MKEEDIFDALWLLYNEHSINGVMIISYTDFKKELERIYIRNSEKATE